ncbi:hypothetical protein CF319_g9074 [Tilletia indica]|nr:hypothetical protein CF319_g9074 [Tilletia indica]
MFAHLVQGVRLAMSRPGVHRQELQDLQDHFVRFIQLWEELYIRGQPTLLHRATISVHHLLHIWLSFYCHGSVRATSQARCEREVGLIKSALRSFKSPFANILNNIRQREHLYIIDLLLDDPVPWPDDTERAFTTKIRSKHRPFTPQELDFEEAAIAELQEQGLIATPRPDHCYRGKMSCEPPAAPSFTVRGNRVDLGSRQGSRFTLLPPGQDPIYGEAVHFLCFQSVNPQRPPIDARRTFVLFKKLENVSSAGAVTRGNWSERLYLAPIWQIYETIGIVELGSFVYILRPLSMPNTL